MSYIEANGTFTFDDVISSAYGVWINGGGTFNAPTRRFREYEVPGRNGTLTIDDGAFDEIEHTYQAFIAESFASNVEAFRNAICSKIGRFRLTDTYHPTEFYLAKYMSGLEADVAPGARGGAFNIKFTRDPRRFLLSGETAQTFTSAGTIVNPTNFASKPLIRAVGSGTLTIGSDVITIANMYPYIDIDSETMQCYYGLQNAAGAVTLQNNDYPTLKPGSTGISMSGLTSVTVTPRWWII